MNRLVSTPVTVTVLRARSPWARLRGLLGGRVLPAGQALLLEPCRAIHTVGMGRAIDVVFVDRDGVVLELRRGLGAGRIAFCRAAAGVLELGAGDAWRLGLWPGCRVRFVEGRVGR